jgi:hypothetical protein
MVQLFANRSFALEAIEEDWVSFHVRVRDLERNLFVVPHVYSAENRCHSASGYWRLDPVVVNLRPSFNAVKDTHQAQFSTRTNESTLSGEGCVSPTNS